MTLSCDHAMILLKHYIIQMRSVRIQAQGISFNANVTD